MADYVSDTHGLIWYLEDDPRLGPEADQAFSACDRGEVIIYIPTICLVEIIYLQEKGRISSDLLARFNTALRTGATGLTLASLTEEVAAALAHVPRSAVPDMPDRIIAATGLQRGLPVISKDRKIRLSTLTTIW